ncbi:MAG: restriction endonuclease subunit S [Clostridium sp.]
MSKLDELIAELCPNGVPFKKVKDIYTRIKGTPITARKMKEIACENGEIRIFAGGKTIIDTHEKDIPKANITRVPAVLVQSRGVIDVVYYDKPFTFKNEMWAYTSEDIVSVKFLYYVLKNSIQTFRDAASGMGALPQISLKVTEEFMLPVPPLEVQREIVHILDSFALLTAELTARQKQYSYYRDELLKPQKSIPMVTLKEIATSIYRGAGIKRDQVTENGIPCVRYGEIYTTYNTWFDKCVSYTKEEYVSSPKYFEHGDILFAITGESVEDIAKSIAYIGHDKCLAGGDIVVMKHQQNPRYLAHVLNTTMAREQKGKGKVKNKVVHSNIPSIEQIKIPLPSLEVQERYANILDNFEQICNDLNIGLPAEIEARQKQYEFYRDLLLTFAETNGSLVTDRQTDRQTEHN